MRTVEEYVNPSLTYLRQCYEEGSLKLQNSQINKKFLDHALNALISNKHIKFIKDKESFAIIPVIEGVGNAYEVRNKAKEMAIKDKSYFKDVYALGRAFTMDYTFASTVHKAQGSEFSRVWIDKGDIQKSIFGGSYRNYARLMYVAISRAKQKIFVI